MRAAGITALGEPVQIFEVDEPAPPAPDEVLIEVAAAGVGNWDELVRIGSWQIGGPAPMALGTEATGTVAAVGSGVDEVRAGDEVLTHPLPLRRNGTWATRVLAPAAATVPAASVPSAIGAGPPTSQSPTLTRSSQLPIPAAATSMRTSPAAGVAGSSSSKISTGSPSAVIPAARICSAARYWRRWCRAPRSAPLKDGGQELRVLALRRVSVRVDDQILVAVVRGLERHTGVDADEPTGRHVDPLRRLADV